MAKISLTSTDAGRTFTAGANDEIIGTTGTADLIVVDASANGVVVNGGGGGDVITMAGSVRGYTVQQDGSRLMLTNAAGGVTYIALSDADTTINFADATAVATIDGTNMMLGAQNVTGLTTATAITGTTIFTDGTLNHLTPGRDILAGTAGDDTFTGYIWDNQNTFQSGDIINGGAGTDIVNAEIGDSQNFAIGAKTTSVENFFFQAQAVAWDSSDNFIANEGGPLGDQGFDFNYREVNIDGATQVDAQDLQGVRQLWSDNSRANLVIEDVRENSHTTTIGMRDTDPGNVNYEVYFDPQHITGPGEDSEGAMLTIRLADVLDLGKGGDGLSNLPYSGFTLAVGGVNYTLDIDFSALTSYADFADAIEAALAAEGLTGITVTQNADETAVFSITVTDGGETYVQGTVGGLYAPITLTNSGSEDLALVSYTLIPGSQEPSGNIVRTTDNDPADTTPSLTQVDVILDNVARGDASGSGDLLIGDMSESGIQQFNVQVDRSSHIDQLASTNNVLEVVNVTNDFTANPEDTNNGEEGANGDLIINQLDDVRVFDASTMVGDVTLTAFLSENVTQKYLDLQDIQEDPAADNSEIPYLNVVDTEFSYDLGTGDDTLALLISDSNLNAAGTTNREDFVLNIQGGTGNDDITLAIIDDQAELSTADDDTHWYINSVLNANLSIDAGAGDDVVNTPGSGNVIIDLGTGNDTVYADNTGDKALYVFNSADIAGAGDGNTNIQSDVNDSYRIYNGELTVTYKGFESTVDLLDTEGEVTDLQINQAIKNAINNDAVLSKLLVANDGPANTLVVTALIDGVMDDLGSEIGADDLMVDIDVPTSLTQSDVLLLNSWYGTPNAVAADHLATFLAELAAFYAKEDYESELVDDADAPFDDLAGDYSAHTSDNIITGDTGNDIFVLGTGELSNDTLVYEGYNNGNDTVVNFQVGLAPADTVAGTPETFVATFTAAVGPGAFEFDGVQINIPLGTETAAQVAALVDAQVFPNWTTVDNLDGTVTFTQVVDGNVTDVTPADFADPYAGPALAITQGTPGVAIPADPGTFEQYNVIFNTSTGAGNFIFTDPDTAAVVTVAIGAGATPAQIATAVAAADFSATNWTVTNNNDGTITLSSDAVGSANTDLTSADFAASVAGILSNVVQIAPGTAAAAAIPAVPVTESFVATFGDATDVDAGWILFAGEEIPVLRGDTGADIALQAAAGSYTGWTAAAAVGNTVTFTSTTAGTNVADAVFTYQVANSLTVDVTDGAEEQGELANVDFVDFSDYLGNAFAQYDLGDALYQATTALVAGDRVVIANNPGVVYGVDNVVTAADFATQTVALDEVLMVESNTNDGFYTMYHVTHAASATATAVTVNVIGTLDFGFELAPGAQNMNLV